MRIGSVVGCEGEEVELRQIFEAEDFGDLVDKVPEVFEAEARFRKAAEAKAKAGQKDAKKTAKKK